MYTNCYSCGKEGHRRSECPTKVKVPAATRPPAVAEGWEDPRYPQAIALPVQPVPLSNETVKLIDATRAELQILNAPVLRDGPSQYERRMWTLRGQERSRRRFADPHPDDFKGGLPTPAEYVTAGSPPAPPQSAPTSHPAEQPPPTAHTA